MTLHTTAVEKLRHGGATEERQIATEEQPVKARQGALDLVGVLGDEVFHALIAQQLKGELQAPVRARSCA